MIDTPKSSGSRSFRSGIASWVAIGVVAAAVTLPVAARAQDEPVEVRGKAALEHPAGKAVVEAARLLAAGRLAEVKSRSAKEVRDEWAALSAAEQREEADRARERAPDPQAFEADVARIGVLTIYGDSATLRIPTAEDEVSAMAFASLEDGQWKVTGGPMTFAPAPVETAPPIVGEAILEHEIGRLALEYAGRLEKGDLDGALELLSDSARARRAAEPDAEREKSDGFRRRHLPPAATFARDISAGGRLSFTGETAHLNVVTNVTTSNPDGTSTFTSNTTLLPFALQDGKWTIGD